MMVQDSYFVKKIKVELQELEAPANKAAGWFLNIKYSEKGRVIGVNHKAVSPKV